MSDAAADNSWVLDRRVPIALILAILGQTGLGVWWAATISERVGTGERRVTVLEAHDAKIAETVSASAAALASIKASQDAMKSAIDRIERNIDAKK